jgi:UDP-4-amino-4,6-dideoxy-N-acetyl-beta-L-altrosamine transaminase
MKFLPYARQTIDDDDIAAVTRVLQSDWLTTGPEVQAFEEELARRTGAKYAVACSSGTAGLHLAALAAGLGPGDHSVVSAVTFLATANASRYVNAEVLFADADPDNGLSHTRHFQNVVEANSDLNIRALFPVHLCGQTMDMESLAAYAREKGLMVIEDACHALGTTYTTSNGEAHRVGACDHSDMAVFSFHPVKTIAMGEGGAVTTNDKDLYEKLCLFRNHGMHRNTPDFVNTELAIANDGTTNPWYYEMSDLGYNYRASDIHCALALSQLRKLEAICARRREIALLYSELLQPLAPSITQLTKTKDVQPVFHLYPVLVDFPAFGIDRAAFMNRLREMGIGTQVHYLPVNRQSYYRQRYGDLELPGANAYYNRALALPFYPALTDEDVNFVVSGLVRLAG